MSDVDPYAEKAPEPAGERPRHILVLANETVAGTVRAEPKISASLSSRGSGSGTTPTFGSMVANG